MINRLAVLLALGALLQASGAAAQHQTSLPEERDQAELAALCTGHFQAKREESAATLASVEAEAAKHSGSDAYAFTVELVKWNNSQSNQALLNVSTYEGSFRPLAPETKAKLISTGRAEQARARADSSCKLECSSITSAAECKICLKQHERLTDRCAQFEPNSDSMPMPMP